MSPNESMKVEIASRLRWAREQAGLSQGQVASALNLHRPTISQIESGRRNVQIHELESFASLYGVQEEWLKSGDEAISEDRDSKLLLAAREMGKLKQDDLNTILKLIRVLQSSEENQ